MNHPYMRFSDENRMYGQFISVNGRYLFEVTSFSYCSISCDVVLCYRNVVLEAEVVVNGSPRHALGFLEHGHALEQLAFGLVLAELADRSQQGLKERFLRGTATYDVSADAVDRGIEVVEADIGLAQGIGPYDLLREQLHAVVQDHDVVAVPTYRTAHVQQDLRE